MLRSRLDTIAASLEEEIDPAIREAAEAIAEGAKERVPVDSGDLKDAIHVDRQRDGVYAIVAGGGDVFYGHLVEQGTTKTPARPFLVPAIEAERDNIDELARRFMGDL